MIAGGDGYQTYMVQNPIPPAVPSPSGGFRIYPIPIPIAPPAGVEPDEPDHLRSEAEVIRQQEAERRREQDLVELLTEDHRTVGDLLAELTASDTTPARRHEVAEVAVAEISRHLAAERRYLVPTAQTALPDGHQVADAQLANLSEVEDAVAQVDEQDPGDAGFGGWCDELAEHARRHAEDQERHLFPRLRDAVDREELRELAQRARAAEASAPTRPHPHAPEQRPWSAVTDPVVGAADRIRDEVTGRPTDPRDIR